MLSTDANPSPESGRLVDDRPLTQLHHGTSRRDPSEAEVNAVCSFLFKAISSMNRLAENKQALTGVLQSAAESIRERSNGWRVPGVQEGRDKEMVIPESLFPASWGRLKRVRKATKAKLEQYGDMSPEPGFTGALLRYVSQDGALTVETFMEQYGKWIGGRLDRVMTQGAAFEADMQAGSALDVRDRAHRVFVGLFGVAKSLHALCEMCPDLAKRMETVRETCAEVLELYRLQDDILTGGIEAALWDAAHQKSKILASGGEMRRFQRALYDDPSSPICRLQREWSHLPIPEPNVLFSDSGKLVEVMLQTKPALLSTKHELLLTHLTKRFAGAKEKWPQVIVACDTEILAGLSQRAIWDYLQSSAPEDGPPKFRSALVLNSAGEKKKKELFTQFNSGIINALVVTEFPKTPVASEVRHVCVLALVQHATRLKEYAWARALIDEGAAVEHVDLIGLQIRGSSDYGRRQRALRYQSGKPIISADLPASARMFLRWSIDTFKSLNETEVNDGLVTHEVPDRVSELLQNGKEALVTRERFEILSRKVLLAGCERLKKAPSDATVERSVRGKLTALLSFSSLNGNAPQFFNEAILASFDAVLDDPVYMERMRGAEIIRADVISALTAGAAWLRKERKYELAGRVKDKLDALSE